MATTAPPPSPAPSSRPSRRPVALVLGLVAVLLVAGCATVQTIADLTDRLEDDGFRHVRVTVDQRDLGVLVVNADAPRGSSTEEGQEAAAEVVWTTFPRRFDAVRTTIDGEGRRWSHAELQDTFGDRPEGLDGTALESDLTRLVVGSIVGVVVVGVVLLVVVGVTILLVVRSRRRRVVGQPVPPVQPWMPPGHQPVPPPPLGATPEPGPAPVSAPSGRHDREARRSGRRPPGSRPDAAHTPPGWD